MAYSESLALAPKSAIFYYVFCDFLVFLLFWSYEALELWSPSGALEDFESALKRLAVVENPYIRLFNMFLSILGDFRNQPKNIHILRQ